MSTDRLIEILNAMRADSAAMRADSAAMRTEHAAMRTEHAAMREEMVAAMDRMREETINVLQGMWVDMKSMAKTLRRDLDRGEDIDELRARLDRVESHVGLR